MAISDYVKFTISNLRSRKKRSLLTIISIVIGISAVVALISLGYGLEGVINEQFELMGTDKIMILPGSIMSAFTGGGAELTEDDMDTIKGVNGIKLASAIIFKSARVEFRGETKYTFVSGMPTDETKGIIESMQNVQFIDGRGLKQTDTNAVIIGYLIANNGFFAKNPEVGDKVSIEGTSFKVVGILGRIGNQGDDTQMIITLDTARELFDVPDKIDTIFAQTKQGFDAGAVAEDLEEALRKERGVKKGEEDFTVQTTEQLMETFSMIFSLVLMVVIGIAGISLLVGGVGIMNTMYMSILERTREIGVMKSIGAMNRDVLTIFLIESGFLGLFGGAIGCALGIAMAKLVEIVIMEQFLVLKAYVSLDLVVGALLFSFIIGIVSGFLPARRAAKMDPVEALRYE